MDMEDVNRVLGELFFQDRDKVEAWVRCNFCSVCVVKGCFDEKKRV